MTLTNNVNESSADNKKHVSKGGCEMWVGIDEFYDMWKIVR